MEIIHNYQTLVDNMDLDKYGYIEIQGYEGRDPEKLLHIRAFKSKDSQELSGCSDYDLQEKHRESVKEDAVRHGIEFEELPDRETKTKVQKEFEGWLNRIKEKEMDEINHYEKALEFAKELSHGVLRGYWKNEISNLSGIRDLDRNALRYSEDSNRGRERLVKYIIQRIGHGNRTGQSYTTKRGGHYYHGVREVGHMDSMISTMVGIGMLKRVDGTSIYELTGEAFALLRKLKWHERHAKFLSGVSIVSGIFSTVAVILSIILMLRELGIV